MRKTISMEKGLKLLAELQETGSHIFPCPRCGHERMNADLPLNSLSRRYDIYICSDCGREEAWEDLCKEDSQKLQLKDWSFVTSCCNK